MGSYCAVRLCFSGAMGMPAESAVGSSRKTIPSGQRSSVISALLTLPVAGTALYLDDQYLHPRALATAAILAAIAPSWITAGF